MTPRLLITIAISFCCINYAFAEPAKVLFINSYHDGYPPSDEVTEAFMAGAEAKGLETELFYMDTKRESDPFTIIDVTRKFLERRAAFQPDLVVAADDNAVRYIVGPFLKGSDTPVVFCGVNWDCSQYGLPAANVTGMLEVLPLRESIRAIKQQSSSPIDFLVLSEHSNSERSNKELLDPLFREEGLAPQYRLVSSFDAWKEAFKAAQSEFDLIYLPTNGAIKGWDHDEAVAFVAQHTRKPTFTCDEFMMAYCAFGRTKIAAEQGEWALKASLEILDGIDPSAIPVEENQRSKLWINQALFDQSGLKLPDEVISQATLIE